MNQSIRRLNALRMKETAKHLESHQFEVFLAESQEEVREILDKMVQDGSRVARGGSETLNTLGFDDFVNEKNLDYIDPSSMSGNKMQGYREALGADYYFMSSNAVTEDGYLYNVDGFGNRVTALSFGPKNVVVIAGGNKIVKDLDAAVLRVKEIAAPANAIRLQQKTPCAVTGVCSDCSSPDRICSTFVATKHSNKPQRIKIILVNEHLGF